MSSRRPTATTTLNTHESLMASMMARSTPRVLLHSPVVRHTVTALEILSACYALALLIILCTLHVRFVRRDGCASALLHLDPILSNHAAQHRNNHASQTPPDEESPLQTYPHRQHAQKQRNEQEQYQQASADQRQHNVVPPLIEVAIVDNYSTPSAAINNETATTSCTHHQVFRFSQERGLLLLSDQSLTALNVSVTRVLLPSSHRCLGDQASRMVLRYLVGYDTVAINAFARMRRRAQSLHGYVLIVDSRRVLNLLHADPGATHSTEMPFATRLIVHLMRKCGAIVTAVFILCTTAALVAFTLREVQVRMIKLTIDLQLIMRSQMGYGRVVIRYATDALVFVPIIAGMLFFLFEFFDDQALAFAVLVITWLCEFAVSGSTRHWISRSYLPKLLFFFFVAFHIYFFSFPLGFSWLSFTTSLSWMVHSALAIWNHCELPLLRNELNPQQRSRWR